MADWTRPQERALLAAAETGMLYRDIAAHLYRLGYPLRTAHAICFRLRKIGYFRGWGRPWTDAEDARIRAAYAAGESLRAVARSIGRTASMMRYRCEYLGLAGTHVRPVGFRSQPGWTEIEVSILRAGYGKEPTAGLAQRLGRSTGAVRVKARALGIEHGYHRRWSDDELRAIRLAHAHGLSISDLADAIGRDPAVVSRQAKRRMGLHFDNRLHRAPRGRRAEREPVTMAAILALGGGAVDRTRPAWSVIAGAPLQNAAARSPNWRAA